ncbi:DNA-binding transcriptional regulator, GntR family [Kytococcus aerolatus]|uniref:DNA-binding transcriptional regulator, GntR family n=1 Tax=Kytococcus aerolatus TaxID=592308 RepID=A0A212TBK5_9MICO|nr:GntR family transcriptional regulator [Kytococcus aerolatus]SNC63428.1 DNA-binding transcriptional regulator, GntR family [Kytococcus aerolatus]
MTDASVVPAEAPAGPLVGKVATGAEGCASRLRALVAGGDLAPGEQLVEVALAERFGVSRNTLREGFRVLASEGLLVHRPHRGVFVHSPSVEDVRDLYAARRAVECGALREAELRARGGLAPVEEVDRLEGLVLRAQKAVHEGDFRAVGDLNTEFHRALIAMPGVPTLTEWGERLLARARLAFRSHEVPERLHADFVPRNASLVPLLAAGDFAASARELRGYLATAEEDVVGGILAARRG